MSKINKIIFDNKEILKLKDLNNLDSINLEVLDHFNCDLSTNISLVLAKANKLSPVNLANDIKDLLMKNINHFESIDIAGPGFLNIKLSRDGFAININNILENRDTYGSKKSNKTYNIEFVSANQLDQCMWVIVGSDIWRCLSNLLLFR